MALIDIDQIKVMGSALTTDQREALTKAGISGNIQEVTQMDLEFLDPRWAMLERGVFKLGMSVAFSSFNMEIANISTGSSENVETTILKCRPVVVRKLKNLRGPRVLSNISPSDFVTRECQTAGVHAVVQPSAKQSSIARDVPQPGQQEVSQPPSAWTTFQRLAGDQGFVVFESLGTIFFGKPSWIINNAGLGEVVVTYKATYEDENRIMNVPACQMTEDEPAVTVSFSMLCKAVDFVRPGKKLQFLGVPTFVNSYAITSFELDLLSTPSLVEVEAGVPIA